VPKLKQGDMAKLACGMKELINKEYITKVEKNFEMFISIQNQNMIMAFLSAYNEYFPMLEKWMSP